MRKSKSSFLHVRVTAADHQKFTRKASRHSTPSDVLRELVIAYTENRVVITQPTVRSL